MWQCPKYKIKSLAVSTIIFFLQCLGLSPEELEQREVDFLDIAYDEIKPHHYKEAEDPKYFKSEKTGRGPLVEGWRDTQKPIMCCYKLVNVKFEVWGLQTRVEEYVQGVCIYTCFWNYTIKIRILFYWLLFD